MKSKKEKPDTIGPEKFLKEHAPDLLAALNKIYSNARTEIKKIESDNRRIKKTGRK